MSFQDIVTSDLDAIFDLGTFAVEVFPENGSSFNAIVDYRIENGAGIENQDVEITARYSDVSALGHGDILVIRGVTYYLIETPRDDGTGVSVFRVSLTA